MKTIEEKIEKVRNFTFVFFIYSFLILIALCCLSFIIAMLIALIKVPTVAIIIGSIAVLLALILLIEWSFAASSYQSILGLLIHSILKSIK